MSRDLDPYNWGDYPSAADLAPDMCALAPKCTNGNEWPRSRNCYQHATETERAAIDAFYSSGPTFEERRLAAVERAEDATVDQDWGLS